ncbi:hypothetical protein RND71_043666 [Anisodus tanguticus]|uniref:Uncharacterized protein n=1 Tax=Anisodus tanguticus TaxID=243964 RepID=A0AAE1QRA3_9SOLA|nr:hypothetical protein RND71_043666 [Anisodus tanguticus]
MTAVGATNVGSIKIYFDKLLTDEGYRVDGRKKNEIRKFNCKLGVFEQADGSAYVEMGNTKVLAAVYGPHDIRFKKSKSLHDKAFINCQYSMATFSTNERKKKPRGDFRAIEITNKVLQFDGSSFSACINAATLAITHAGIPIKDIVCACSAGLVSDQTITDVNYQEESIGIIPILTTAILPKDKQILSLEQTGRIQIDSLNQLMDAAMEGCQDIYHLLKQYRHLLKYLNKFQHDQLLP